LTTSKTLSGEREVIEPRLSEHIPALDAVRGLAILLVLVFHFSSYGHGLPPAGVFADRIFHVISRAGWVGVDLFFVLSGFLITGILYDSKASVHYFRNFYARRVLRIFPVYYGSLVVFLVVLPHLFPDNDGLRALQSDGFWYWTYLSNVRIAHDGWPLFGALGHFWSLAVEEQFYVVWPVVVLLCTRSQLIQIGLFCIGGSLVARVGLTLTGHQTAAFVLTPARMDALAVGAILALTARGPTGVNGIARLASPAAGLLSLVLVAISLWRGGLASYDPVISTIGHTLLACLFGAVLVLALTSPRHTFPGRMFSSSLLRFFGRYSYALYVFHHPILFFTPGLLPLGWVPTFFGSLLLKKFVFIISATAFSVVLALISWHLYETQFLKLKRLFPYQSGEAEASPFQAESAAVCSQTPLAKVSEPGS